MNQWVNRFAKLWKILQSNCSSWCHPACWRQNFEISWKLHVCPWSGGFLSRTVDSEASHWLASLNQMDITDAKKKCWHLTCLKAIYPHPGLNLSFGMITNHNISSQRHLPLVWPAPLFHKCQHSTGSKSRWTWKKSKIKLCGVLAQKELSNKQPGRFYWKKRNIYIFALHSWGHAYAIGRCPFKGSLKIMLVAGHDMNATELSNRFGLLGVEHLSTPQPMLMTPKERHCRGVWPDRLGKR